MEEEGVAEGAETLAQMASGEPPQVGGNDSGGMGGEIPAQDEGESTRAQAVARATPLYLEQTKSKELPSEEQLLVARGIKPGAQHWNTKDKSFPKENRPGAPALVFEVLCRDPSSRPKAWDVVKLCKWLHEHPVPFTEEAVIDEEKQEKPPELEPEQHQQTTIHPSPRATTRKGVPD